MRLTRPLSEDEDHSASLRKRRRPGRAGTGRSKQRPYQRREGQIHVERDHRRQEKKLAEGAGFEPAWEFKLPPA